MVLAANHAVRPDGNSVCRAFPESAKQALYPQLVSVQFDSAEVLSKSGDTLNWVYFPLDAIISTSHVMQDGSSVGISLTGNEGMVGSEVILKSRRSIGQSTVVQPGWAFRLPVRQLTAEIDRDDALRGVFLDYEKYLLAQIVHATACARLHHTGQRLSRLLLCMQDRMHDNEITMTQETIAAILGVRRESISVAATQLQQAKVIELKRGRMVIRDRSGLEAHSCECYATMKKLRSGVV